MAGQIFELIPKVMGAIGAVAKTSKNTQQNYAFRGIEAFYLAAHPALIAHSVFCAPQVIEREVYRFEKVNNMGDVKTWVHVTLKVNHRFYAPDGSFIEVITVGEGLDNSDKASNKAMSGAMKYALIELFCVPTQDVEDADRDSPEAGTKQAATVDRTEKPIPLTPGERILAPEDQRISLDQQKKLHMRFRDSLSEDLKPKADALLHDFLGRKLLIDEHGNPSTKAILKAEYATIGREAVALAKDLSANPAEAETEVLP